MKQAIHTALAAKASNPLVQRRLYEQMTSVDEVVTLLGNPSLAPDLDAEIAQRTESAVLAAWLRRPGRSSADYLAMLERNQTATLRTEVAAASGLPAQVYHSLLDKPTFTVAATLAANADAPARAREQAARCYAELHPAHRQPPTGQRLGPVFGTSLARWAIPLLRNTDRPALVQALMEIVEFDRDDIHEAAIRVLVPALVATEAARNSAIDALVAILRFQPQLDRADRQALVDELVAELPHDAVAETTSTLRTWLVRGAARSSRSVRAVPRFEVGAETRRTLEEQVTDASSAEDLEQLTAAVIAAGDQAAAAAVIRNPYSNVDQVAAVIDLIEAPERRELADVRIDNPAVTATLLAACSPHHWNAVLAKSSDPQRLLLETLRRHVPGQWGIRSQIPGQWLTRESLQLLRIDFVAGQNDAHAADLLGGMLAETLPSPQAWAVFDALTATKFDGTIGDLLTACAGVAAS